jgi:hypothetical protein
VFIIVIAWHWHCGWFDGAVSLVDIIDTTCKKVVSKKKNK